MFARKHLAVAVLAVIITLVCPSGGRAAGSTLYDDRRRSPGAVVDNLIKELNEAYVFADVAKKMEADLRRRQSARNTIRSFPDRLSPKS